MPRVKLSAEAIETVAAIESGGGIYFDELEEPSEFIRTGCTLLDQVLGGGWALGRISNIYGNESAGKTLLGIEGTANFLQQFPDAKPFYRERESAFDFTYADTLGFDRSRIDFRNYEDGLDTVEDLYDDMDGVLDGLLTTKEPAFYCIDSLDAFPDHTELAQTDIRKAGEVAKKGRVLSQSFRLSAGRIAQTRMHVMYVSQMRNRIGVTMGRKTEAAGGQALRFYASQRLHLRQIEKIRHTIKGQDIVTGVWVEATNEKSKVGMPYRKCQFPILFNYGIDDLTACVEFLSSTGDLKKINVAANKKDMAKYIEEVNAMSDKDHHDEMAFLRKTTREVWAHIDELAQERFLPPRRKYA